MEAMERKLVLHIKHCIRTVNCSAPLEATLSDRHAEMDVEAMGSEQVTTRWRRAGGGGAGGGRNAARGAGAAAAALHDAQDGVPSGTRAGHHPLHATRQPAVRARRRRDRARCAVPFWRPPSPLMQMLGLSATSPAFIERLVLIDGRDILAVSHKWQ